MAKKEQILELLNAYKSEVDNFNDAVFTDKFDVLAQDIVKLFVIPDVSITLPNKDATICEGYNKAKMQDYQNRNVLRHKDQDDYYSGWMDCYDWISKGN